MYVLQTPVANRLTEQLFTKPETDIISAKQLLERITGTPHKYSLVRKVTSFIPKSDYFGVYTSRKPNTVYFSSDTIYIDKLLEIHSKRQYITATLLNPGNTIFYFPTGPIRIIIDGKQAIRLARDIGVDVIIPIYFESWSYFTWGLRFRG